MAETEMVACAYCGTERVIFKHVKAYKLKKNPLHNFYCDSKCQGKARPGPPMVTEVCAMCGVEFSVEASKAKARKKKNGGAITCSAICGSARAGITQRLREEAALASGEMTCARCKKVLPLDSFPKKPNAR